MCDIPNTILEKIDGCDIFLADLTFVGESVSGNSDPQKMPNCNVVFELGYAAKCHGFSSLVGVVNEAFGKSDGQIFDIKRRACISYNMPHDPDPSRYGKERKRLSKTLEDVFRLTLDTVVAERRKESVGQEAGEFAQMCLKHGERILHGRFLEFSKLPASSIVIQGNERFQLDFAELHARLQSEGLILATQASSLSWGNDVTKSEINLAGMICDAYAGDFESFKNLYRTNQMPAARLDSSGQVPSLLHADTVQKNIICRVHRYCQLLAKLEVLTPWTIGVSLVGAEGFRLVTNSDKSPRACDENVIQLSPAVVSDVTHVATPNATARQLRRPLDELCRHFGWPKNIGSTTAEASRFG